MPYLLPDILAILLPLNILYALVRVLFRRDSHCSPIAKR